jgi:hypothetical protein
MEGSAATAARARRQVAASRRESTLRYPCSPRWRRLSRRLRPRRDVRDPRLGARSDHRSRAGAGRAPGGTGCPVGLGRRHRPPRACGWRQDEPPDGCRRPYGGPRAAGPAGAVIPAEARLSDSALGDLVAGLGEESWATLPLPQRRALEVALPRAEPHGERVEPRAVALGLAGLLRAAAADSPPIILAIDDTQWLDRPSAVALVRGAPSASSRQDVAGPSPVSRSIPLVGSKASRGPARPRRAYPESHDRPGKGKRATPGRVRPTGTGRADCNRSGRGASHWAKRGALTRGPSSGRPDRAEPLARPTRQVRVPGGERCDAVALGSRSCFLPCCWR